MCANVYFANVHLVQHAMNANEFIQLNRFCSVKGITRQLNCILAKGNNEDEGDDDGAMVKIIFDAKIYAYFSVISLSMMNNSIMKLVIAFVFSSSHTIFLPTRLWFVFI